VLVLAILVVRAPRGGIRAESAGPPADWRRPYVWP